jgi:hypothetical protein
MHVCTWTIGGTILTGETGILGRKLRQWHFSHHESHTHCPALGAEPSPTTVQGSRTCVVRGGVSLDIKVVSVYTVLLTLVSSVGVKTIHGYGEVHCLIELKKLEL